MIDFSLTEEEELIRNSARSFASARLRPHGERHEEKGGVQADIEDEYRKLGLSLLEVPQDLGGGGLGAFAKCLVVEELAWGDAGAALALEGVWPAYYAVIECAPADLKKNLLGRLASGNETPRAALVVDVDNKIHVSNGTLDGVASFVPSGEAEVVALVKDQSVLLVDAKGARTKPLTGCALQASAPMEIQFNKARVLHATSDKASVERVVARIRLYVASLMLGVARAAHEYSMKYAQERSAFGKPIAHHQALAFYIADMATAVDAARLSIWRAVYQLQTGQQIGWHAAAAYQEAAQHSRFVTDYGVQILGGHGYIKDHPVEKWMREAQVLSTIWGGMDQADLDACELVLAE